MSLMMLPSGAGRRSTLLLRLLQSFDYLSFGLRDLLSEYRSGIILNSSLLYIIFSIAIGHFIPLSCCCYSQNPLFLNFPFIMSSLLSSLPRRRCGSRIRALDRGGTALFGEAECDMRAPGGWHGTVASGNGCQEGSVRPGEIGSRFLDTSVALIFFRQAAIRGGVLLHNGDETVRV